MTFKYRALSVNCGRIAAAWSGRSAVASQGWQAIAAIPPVVRRVLRRMTSRESGVSGACPVNGLSDGSSLNFPGWASLSAQQPLGRGFLGDAPC